MSEKHCYVCNITKDITAFGKHKRCKDGHRNFCLECASASNKNYNSKYHSAYKDYLKLNGCVVCKNNHPDVLEVHHYATEYKRYGRSQSRVHNLDDLLSNKAVILCANCHSLFHAIHGGKTQPFPLYSKEEMIMKIKQHMENHLVDTA